MAEQEEDPHTGQVWDNFNPYTLEQRGSQDVPNQFLQTHIGEKTREVLDTMRNQGWLGATLPQLSSIETISVGWNFIIVAEMAVGAPFALPKET